MALIHAPGTFSGGLTRTLMMAGRHSYVLYAYQTDVFTLPLPYETACTDYQVHRNPWVQAPRTQEEECEETCMQGEWRKWCGCVSASYMLRHRVDVPICSNIARFKCQADLVTPEKLQSCRINCSRPCASSVYRARIFRHRIKVQEPSEFRLTVSLGSHRRNIVRSDPMLTRDTLFSYLEGHIGMWLGISLLSLVQLAAIFYNSCVQRRSSYAGLAATGQGEATVENSRVSTRSSKSGTTRLGRSFLRARERIE
ncbi:hypothetical protein ISCGN_007139 [Ixodes scapularis]